MQYGNTKEDNIMNGVISNSRHHSVPVPFGTRGLLADTTKTHYIIYWPSLGHCTASSIKRCSVTIVTHRSATSDEKQQAELSYAQYKKDRSAKQKQTHIAKLAKRNPPSSDSSDINSTPMGSVAAIFNGNITAPDLYDAYQGYVKTGELISKHITRLTGNAVSVNDFSIHFKQYAKTAAREVVVNEFNSAMEKIWAEGLTKEEIIALVEGSHE
jgi:hypothetical protein